MFKKILMTAALIGLVAGCATRPDSIPASFVSHEKYIDSTCARLDTQMADARMELAKHSDKQNNMANLDAATVFFVLVPASKLTGDSAGDVAKWKGEVEAIETAQIKRRCK